MVKKLVAMIGAGLLAATISSENYAQRPNFSFSEIAKVDPNDPSLYKQNTPQQGTGAYNPHRFRPRFPTKKPLEYIPDKPTRLPPVPQKKVEQPKKITVNIPQKREKTFFENTSESLATIGKTQDLSEYGFSFKPHYIRMNNPNVHGKKYDTFLVAAGTPDDMEHTIIIGGGNTHYKTPLKGISNMLGMKPTKIPTGYSIEGMADGINEPADGKPDIYFKKNIGLTDIPWLTTAAANKDIQKIINKLGKYARAPNPAEITFYQKVLGDVIMTAEAKKTTEKIDYQKEQTKPAKPLF